MESNTKNHSEKILLIGLTVTTLLSLVLIAFHQEERSEVVTAIMCALASMSIGIVVGFLFGIPKTDSKNADTNRDSQAGKNIFSKRPNTNLEEISDWLTKIIIGVSLVEFQNISTSLNSAAQLIAKSMGNNPDSHQGYIMALLVFYLMFGFLVGYILTRVILANIFSQADQSIASLNDIQTRLEDTESRISDHSEVESLVAQADYFRRESKESNISSEEKNKKLVKSEAILNMAINIDKNNIPAHIALSKCFSDRNEQEKAWEKLELLEENLKKLNVSPKTHARIKYNKGCYHVLYATSKSGEIRKKHVDEAFSLLNEAVQEEKEFKTIAKDDADWKGLNSEEAKRFKDIVGE